MKALTTRRPLRPGDVVSAAMAGDADAVRRLLELGFPVDAVDAQGCTGLLRAAGGGHAAAVDLLRPSRGRGGSAPQPAFDREAALALLQPASQSAPAREASPPAAEAPPRHFDFGSAVSLLL